MPKILIVSSGAAFMTDTMKKGFEEAGMETFLCEPFAEMIEAYAEHVDSILLYCGEFVEEDPELLKTIGKVCEDNFLYLFAAGHPNELNAVEKQVNVSLITAEFMRPFDVKDLIAGVKAIAFGEMASDSGVAVVEKKRILVCNDDNEFLQKVKEVLSTKYQVTVIQRGILAATLAEKDMPDLILLGYELPVTSGPRVMEMIRGKRKTAGIPIVFLTKHADRDTVMKVMQLKPQGYMIKSSNYEDLEASVDNFFATGQWRNIQVRL